jgi:hypothetical protein
VKIGYRVRSISPGTWATRNSFDIIQSGVTQELDNPVKVAVGEEGVITGFASDNDGFVKIGDHELIVPWKSFEIIPPPTVTPWVPQRRKLRL